MVVTDSTISLPREVVARHPLLVVPLELYIDGRAFQDGVDITPQEFYRLLPRLRDLPKTSAPRPSAFLQTFEEARSRSADSVLCITITAGVSATYDSARAAAEMARDLYPDLRVEVMDSRTAGGAQTWIALAAARKAATGAGLEGVTEVARRVAERVYFVGALDTLYYIWKGGRIPRVALWASEILRIKPVLEIKEGQVRLVARPRSRARAVESLLEYMEERVGGHPLRVNILHADQPQEARELEGLITSRFRCLEVITTVFTPVIGAHTGPGLLGVAFYAEDGAAP